jgi:hypothetical protein
MMFSNLPPLTWIGLGVVALLILFLLFRRPPTAPQYTPPPAPRRGGIGLFTWVLLIAVIVLVIPHIPWLFTQLSLVTKPAQLSFASPFSVSVAPTAPPSDSIVGTPTITASFIDHVLVDAGSPAQGIGAQLVALGKTYNIDPVYALAFYHHESDYGRKGVATTTNSWGNIKCVNWKGKCDPFTGEYRMYPTIQAGAEDWFALMHSVYIPRGLTTIRTIIPVYAPPSDNNNVSVYIQAVTQDVQRWRDGKMQP